MKIWKIKKSLAVLLAAVLLMSAIPVQGVFADGETQAVDILFKESFNEEGASVSTLDEFLDKIWGCTIWDLCRDYEIEKDIIFSAGYQIGIFLNGHILTMPAGRTLTVRKGIELFIADYTADGGIIADGLFLIEGTLDLSELDYGEAGLISGKAGTMKVADGGLVILPTAFSSTLGWTMETVAKGNLKFLQGEVGALAKLGGVTYVCTKAGTDSEAGEWEVLSDMEARTGDSFYKTLQAAVDEAEDGDTVRLLKDVTLSQCVDITKGSEFTVDLNGMTVTSSDTCDNGTAFNIVSGNVTLQNGLIVGTEDADGEKECDAVTVRSGAVANLVDGLTITVDSQNGACVYAFDGGTVNVTGGTYMNETTEEYAGRSGWYGMVFDQADVADRLIKVTGGGFYGVDPKLGDDSWAEGTFLDGEGITTVTSVVGGELGYRVASNELAFEVKIGEGEATQVLSLADIFKNEPFGSLSAEEPVKVQVDLLRDVWVYESIVVPEGVNLVFDFNGYTYTADKLTGIGNAAFDLTEGSTVLFRGGSGGKKGTIRLTEGTAVSDGELFPLIYSAAGLTLENMSLEGPTMADGDISSIPLVYLFGGQNNFNETDILTASRTGIGAYFGVGETDITVYMSRALQIEGEDEKKTALTVSGSSNIRGTMGFSSAEVLFGSGDEGECVQINGTIEMTKTDMTVGTGARICASAGVYSTVSFYVYSGNLDLYGTVYGVINADAKSNIHLYPGCIVSNTEEAAPEMGMTGEAYQKILLIYGDFSEMKEIYQSAIATADSEVILDGGSVIGEGFGITQYGGKLDIRGGVIHGGYSALNIYNWTRFIILSEADTEVSVTDRYSALKVPDQKEVIPAYPLDPDIPISPYQETDMEVSVTGGMFSNSDAEFPVISSAVYPLNASRLERITGFIHSGLFSQEPETELIDSDPELVISLNESPVTGEKYPCYIGTPEASVDGEFFDTLEKAVQAAEDGDTVKLLRDVVLYERVNVGKSIRIDLNGKTVSPTETCENGSAFNITAGTVSIDNGFIDGSRIPKQMECDPITVRGEGTVANLGLAKEDDADSLIIRIDSRNGACAYAFAGARINVLGGLYWNETDTVYEFNNKMTGMVLNQANVADQLIFVSGGTFIGVDPARGDDSGLAASFMEEGLATAIGSNIEYEKWIALFGEDSKYNLMSFRSLHPVPADTVIAEVPEDGYTVKSDSMLTAVSYIDRLKENKSGTIRLTRDVVSHEYVQVTMGMDLTFDFNGFTYSAEHFGGEFEYPAFQIVDGAKGTLKNGTLQCTEENKTFEWTEESEEKGIVALIQSYGDLTLDGVTVDGTNLSEGAEAVISVESGSAVIEENSVLTGCLDVDVTSSKVDLKSGSLMGQLRITGVSGDTDTDITAGKDFSICCWDKAAVYADGAGEINISGSVIGWIETCAGDDKSGTVTISEGAAIGFDRDLYIQSDSYKEYAKGKTKSEIEENLSSIYSVQHNGGELIIEGGTVTGENGVCVTGGTLSIEGGTFSVLRTALCIDNCYGSISEEDVVVTGGSFRTESKGGEALIISEAYSYPDDGRVTGFIGGGIFSEEIGEEFIKSGLYIAWNPDEDTKAQYPYTVAASLFEGDPEAAIGAFRYETLREAVNAAKDGQTVSLMTSIALENRIDIAAGTKNIVIDLGGFSVIPTATCENGSAFNVISGNVTFKNGCIDGTSVTETECDPITVRAGAAVTLGKGLSIMINSRNGACAYAFAGMEEGVPSGKIYVKGGSYRNLTTEEYEYRAGWTGMVLNQANVPEQLIFVSGGEFIGVDPELGDDSWESGTFLVTDYTTKDEENDEYTVHRALPYVVRDGEGNKFTSLAEALDGASHIYTTKLTLIHDVTVTDQDSVPERVKVELDFGGYTYYVNGSDSEDSFAFFLSDKATVKFKNGTIAYDPEDEDSVGEHRMFIGNMANLTLDNMTLDGENEEKEIYPFIYSLSGNVQINDTDFRLPKVDDAETWYALMDSPAFILMDSNQTGYRFKVSGKSDLEGLILCDNYNLIFGEKESDQVLITGSIMNEGESGTVLVGKGAELFGTIEGVVALLSIDTVNVYGKVHGMVILISGELLGNVSADQKRPSVNVYPGAEIRNYIAELNLPEDYKEWLAEEYGKNAAEESVIGNDIILSAVASFGGDVNIYGGTVSGEGYGAAVISGHVNIVDGDIHGDRSALVLLNARGDMTSEEVSVKGGTFTHSSLYGKPAVLVADWDECGEMSLIFRRVFGDNVIVDDPQPLTSFISGGSFDQLPDNSAFVREDSAADETVKAVIAAVKSESTSMYTIYHSMEEAMTATEDGGTLVLLNTVRLDEGSIINDKDLTLDINGQTVLSDVTAIVNRGGKLTILDSTEVESSGQIAIIIIEDMEGEPEETVYAPGNFNAPIALDVQGGEVTVLAGTYYGEICATGKGAKLSVEGGTYFSDPEIYLADGFRTDVIEIGEESRWIVVADDSIVARVGTKNYSSLQAAVNDADGQTVRLILKRDANGDPMSFSGRATVAAGSSVTIDLNGMVLDGGTGIALNNRGNLTIVDSSEEKTGSVKGSYALYLNKASYTVIRDGNFFGKNADIVRAEGAGLLISGGTFTSAVDSDDLDKGLYPTKAEDDVRFTVTSVRFVITVTSAAGGVQRVATLQGGGMYPDNSTVKLTAPDDPENTGFEFVEWQKDGVRASGEAEYIFDASEGAAYVAVYRPVTEPARSFPLEIEASAFTVSVDGAEAESGTDSLTGKTVPAFSSVTVKYTGSDTFVCWQDATGNRLSGSRTHTFTMVKGMKLVAVTESR